LVGPIISVPTLGGWLTDNTDWRSSWVFLNQPASRIIRLHGVRAYPAGDRQRVRRSILSFAMLSLVSRLAA